MKKNHDTEALSDQLQSFDNNQAMILCMDVTDDSNVRVHFIHVDLLRSSLYIFAPFDSRPTDTCIYSLFKW